MNFLRTLKGCTHLTRFRNIDIRTELNIDDLNSSMNNYRTKWKLYVDRMPEQTTTPNKK